MFNQILLFGKYDGIESWETLDKLITYLHSKDKTVFLDAFSCKDFPVERYGASFLQRDENLEHIDLAMIVGGDGTFLDVARTLVEKEIPVVGINLGRLGFLTDISPQNMLTVLDEILQGDFVEETRNMLSVQVVQEDEVVFEQLAFNDVVLHKNDSPRMIEFEAYIDNRFLSSQRSDGVIISTPTGSTAYALSAGGPILSPNLDVVCLVSINPHTMSNRPVVVPGESQIELRPHENCSGMASIICDGQVTYPISSGLISRISRFPKLIRMIHPKNHDHFKLLRAKLNWGQKLS